MRNCIVIVCLAVIAVQASSQQPTTFGDVPPIGKIADGSKEMFQVKIKAEWEALRNKDKKAYSELLADDYLGVEVDGKGERNKLQALTELGDSNVFKYTLWGFKLIPLAPDAAFVIYEVTMQFPPKAQIHYSRVYITELWMKRAGDWKEVHYQETHVK